MGLPSTHCVLLSQFRSGRMDVDNDEAATASTAYPLPTSAISPGSVSLLWCKLLYAWHVPLHRIIVLTSTVLLSALVPASSSCSSLSNVLSVVLPLTALCTSSRWFPSLCSSMRSKCGGTIVIWSTSSVVLASSWVYGKAVRQ